MRATSHALNSSRLQRRDEQASELAVARRRRLAEHDRAAARRVVAVAPEALLAVPVRRAGRLGERVEDRARARRRIGQRRRARAARTGSRARGRCAACADGAPPRGRATSAIGERERGLGRHRRRQRQPLARHRVAILHAGDADVARARRRARARSRSTAMRRRQAALLDPHEHVIAGAATADTRAPRRRRSPRRLRRAARPRCPAGRRSDRAAPRRAYVAGVASRACERACSAIARAWSACGGPTASTAPSDPTPAKPSRGIEAAALPYQVLDARTGHQIEAPRSGISSRRARGVRRRGAPEPAPSLGAARGRAATSRRAGRALALGMEMFQRPFQGVLDDFAAKRIDDDDAALARRLGRSLGLRLQLLRPDDRTPRSTRTAVRCSRSTRPRS